MPPGGLGIEGLAEAVHIHGGLHHRVQPRLTQGVGYAQAVDHRAQHAHLIRRHRVHVGRRALTSPPDVPRADDDANLHLHIVHIADDLRHPAHLVKIEQIRVGLQRLAGELEQNPLVSRHGKDLLHIVASEMIIYHKGASGQSSGASRRDSDSRQPLSVSPHTRKPAFSKHRRDTGLKA